VLDIIAVIVSVIGTILNARKNIKGFYLWAIGNGMLVIYMGIKAEYSLTAFYLFMIAMNIYGIQQWKKQNGS
jgi:nicotinamide riboside transporter PnuC